MSGSALHRAGSCFHCGEPLRGSTLTVRMEERDEPVCCTGCRAVVELIGTSGLTDYYRYRDALPDGPAAPAGADAWSIYRQQDVAAGFITPAAAGNAVNLHVEGLHCSACAWLIDRTLRNTKGVVDVSVNVATGRARVVWQPDALTLADILEAVARLGYRPQPVTAQDGDALRREERRSSLKRLAVAAFGMMQVMMFAVAEYSAQLAGETMEPQLQQYFRLTSLLVATPVLFYAGAPFLWGAWHSLRAKSIGMDVPVSLALCLAYGASVWNTLLGTSGHVYFDSVTMFVFFLALGRFVQMTVRHRTISVTDALMRQLPALAHRLDGDNPVDVLASSLQGGDRILVRTGEVVPVDGTLLDDATELNEALLTGESLPVLRRCGERLAAGTVNVGRPVRVAVTAVGNATVLSQIARLLERATTRKPRLALAADAAAARFLFVVIAGAVLTCGIWLVVDPSRAFETTLAVLVVACPCAFAIASPAALSAATARLARLGILVSQPDVLEALAATDRFVFDKTGTLTRGQVRIAAVKPVAGMDGQRCLEIAAALEAGSEHPIARPFAAAGSGRMAASLTVHPGQGIEGILDGRRYRIGTQTYTAALRGGSITAGITSQTGTVVWLGDEERELAAFELADVIRPHAAEAVTALADLRIVSEIQSGDQPQAVAAVARSCGIREFQAQCSPEQKLSHLEQLQRDGARVAMVGDGLNDAPVLGAAHVSIAMGTGTALAQATADMVLVTDDLHALARAVRTARQTLRITRQNLAWAAVYNFGSLPLAALGYVPPWLAALGMSLSSALVILNAARLLPPGDAAVSRNRAQLLQPQSPAHDGAARPRYA